MGKCHECGSESCDPNAGGPGVPECCIDSPAYYDLSQYDEPPMEMEDW